MIMYTYILSIDYTLENLKRQSRETGNLGHKSKKKKITNTKLYMCWTPTYTRHKTKTNKTENTTHYVSNTTIRKQTQITQIRHNWVKTNRTSFLCGNCNGYHKTSLSQQRFIEVIVSIQEKGWSCIFCAMSVDFVARIIIILSAATCGNFNPLRNIIAPEALP